MIGMFQPSALKRRDDPAARIAPRAVAAPAGRPRGRPARPQRRRRARHGQQHGGARGSGRAGVGTQDVSAAPTQGRGRRARRTNSLTTSFLAASTIDALQVAPLARVQPACKWRLRYGVERTVVSHTALHATLRARRECEALRLRPGSVWARRHAKIGRRSRAAPLGSFPLSYSVSLSYGGMRGGMRERIR
jgi:hypothetical protein